jgi:hypothetical protein
MKIFTAKEGDRHADTSKLEQVADPEFGGY